MAHATYTGDKNVKASRYTLGVDKRHKRFMLRLSYKEMRAVRSNNSAAPKRPVAKAPNAIKSGTARLIGEPDEYAAFLGYSPQRTITVKSVAATGVTATVPLAVMRDLGNMEAAAMLDTLTQDGKLYVPKVKPAVEAARRTVCESLKPVVANVSDVPCRCAKTGCVQNYCDCFAAGKLCGPLCHAGKHAETLCCNDGEHEDVRNAAICRYIQAGKFVPRRQRTATTGCHCKHGCDTGRCPCRKEGMPCTDKCLPCTNLKCFNRGADADAAGAKVLLSGTAGAVAASAGVVAGL
jgi:hypothetical protein